MYKWCVHIIICYCTIIIGQLFKRRNIFIINYYYIGARNDNHNGRRSIEL